MCFLNGEKVILHIQTIKNLLLSSTSLCDKRPGQGINHGYPGLISSANDVTLRCKFTQIWVCGLPYYNTNRYFGLLPAFWVDLHVVSGIHSSISGAPSSFDCVDLNNWMLKKKTQLNIFLYYFVIFHGWWHNIEPLAGCVDVKSKTMTNVMWITQYNPHQSRGTLSIPSLK
jgi:hypothetical protein